jgi:hypothetical protein
VTTRKSGAHAEREDYRQAGGKALHSSVYTWG